MLSVAAAISRAAHARVDRIPFLPTGMLGALEISTADGSSSLQVGGERGKAHWVCHFVKRQPYWGGFPVCCLFGGWAKVIQGNKIERRAA